MNIRGDMMRENNKTKIASGLIWTFGERILAQLVSTIVMIILARVLSPEHYGIISIVTVFITFCNVFVVSGMGSALVQKKDADIQDYNTSFFISFMIAIILYIVLYILSPVIADFYQMDQLVYVIRVMALRLPIASINTIQQAHIQKQMAFKRFFIATLFGTVISGVIGVIMALYGFGVWALVAQYLANTIIDTIVLLIVDSWKPKLQFSFASAKKIFSFGWKVLATELVFTLESDIRSLVIGKVFGPSDLAYFDQGKKYPAILVNNVNSSINKVMLPVYSKSQDDIERLKGMLRKSVSIGVYILAPIMIGFAVLSDSFIKIILTEKWIMCKPFIIIFCLSFLTRPLETACHQAILAIGRSDVVLRMMILLNSFSIIILLIAVFVFKSVLFIAIGYLISAVVSLVIFMMGTTKLIGYSCKEQFYDVAPSLLCSIIMGGAVHIVGTICLTPVCAMLIQIFVGILIYIALSYIFKLFPYFYLMKFIKKRSKKTIIYN